MLRMVNKKLQTYTARVPAGTSESDAFTGIPELRGRVVWRPLHFTCLCVQEHFFWQAASA